MGLDRDKGPPAQGGIGHRRLLHEHRVKLQEGKRWRECPPPPGCVGEGRAIWRELCALLDDGMLEAWEGEDGEIRFYPATGPKLQQSQLCREQSPAVSPPFQSLHIGREP
jgi:hypothetical protein